MVSIDNGTHNTLYLVPLTTELLKHVLFYPNLRSSDIPSLKVSFLVSLAGILPSLINSKPRSTQAGQLATVCTVTVKTNEHFSKIQKQLHVQYSNM